MVMVDGGVFVSNYIKDNAMTTNDVNRSNKQLIEPLSAHTPTDAQSIWLHI